MISSVEPMPDGLVVERTRMPDVPPSADWMSDREVEIAGGLRHEGRRASWTHGRWTAKRAALRLLREERLEEARRWSILPADDGAPEAWLDGLPLPLSISLSHRAGTAIAVAAAHPAAVGCDVERIEPRSEAFIDDYFVTSERVFVRAVPPGPERDLRANLVWCGKEAVLKVLRTGLRLDTRTVVTTFNASRDTPGPGRWHAFLVFDTRDSTPYRAWWRIEDGYVEAVAIDPDRIR